MTQEVQVTLTLEVDVTQQKGDIENFIKELINTHTFHSSTYNRMVFDFHNNFEIKEEAEIYETEKNITLDFLSWYNNSEYASSKIKEVIKTVNLANIKELEKKRNSLQIELFNYFKNEVYNENT